MNFLELAQSRYTTKKYDPNARVSEEKIQQLKEILSLSPSSINSQPWKFTIVSDEAMKRLLAGVSYFNEPKINDASHVVVFSAIDSVELFEEQIRENLPEGAVQYYMTFIKPKPEAEIKAWLQHQVYLSLGMFLSAAASLEIDSTPMEGIQADKYREILQLDNYQPLVAVALGYRDQEDVNQPSLKAKARLKTEQTIQSI